MGVLWDVPSGEVMRFRKAVAPRKKPTKGVRQVHRERRKALVKEMEQVLSKRTPLPAYGPRLCLSTPVLFVGPLVLSVFSLDCCSASCGKESRLNRQRWLPPRRASGSSWRVKQDEAKPRGL